MKIREITLNGVVENCSNINLILGANNTGKSTFIKELETTIKSCEIIGSSNKWISGAVIESSGGKTMVDSLLPGVLDAASFQLSQKEVERLGFGIFGNGSWSSDIFDQLKAKDDTIVTYSITPKIDGSHRDSEWTYFGFMAALAISIENCDQRLSGPFSTQISRIEQPYGDIIQYFYAQPAVFKKIKDHIKEVFGIEIMFDSLNQGAKDIRLIPDVPLPPSFPNLRSEALFWHEHSTLLQSQGDGLKAYLKILYALFNPSKSIVIIDEPEAFLHSPQRRSLGKFIAENATSGKQIFISTHDSEFLRGVLTNTITDTQIIHLKNKAGIRSYTINPVTTPRRTQSNNELILNSYFNKLTILCEGEDDRVIYQYASQTFFPAKTVDIHFLGVNGKSEVFAVFLQLQRLEIETAAIVDIDVLYSGECLKLILETADEVLIRDTCKLLNALTSAERDLLKKDGVSSITDTILKAKVERCIEIAKKYKLYIVPIGELESWLDSKTVNSRKVQAMKNEIDQTTLTIKKTTLESFIKDVISNV